MPLNFFDDKDFEIRVVGNKRYFSLKNANGFHLVYFFLPSCVHCDNFTPFFHQLPGMLKGNIQFAIVNANNNLPTLALTSDTTTPISEVPYVQLYNDGWPIERYLGPMNLESIRNFITNAQTKMINQATQQTAAPPAQAVQPVSTPKNENAVCYMTYGDAYKPGNCSSRQ